MFNFLFESALNLVIALFGAFVASNIIKALDYLHSKFVSERPPKVLIISRSLWNIQALFVALQNKYKDRRCVYFTQDRFDKEILFEDDENWTIISYYSKLIRQNEINYNEYDKIVFDINLPEDFIKEVTNKVKDRSTIRVCDLKAAINKIEKERSMKNKRRKPTKRNSDIYWNILAYENVGEKGYATYETDIFKSNGIDRVVVYGKLINAKKITRLINIVCSQIIEGDTFRSGITHTIIDDSIGKKIFEFGVRTVRHSTGETVMQLIPSFEYRNIV